MRALVLSVLLTLPAYAQPNSRWTDTSWAPPDVVSVRNCRRPPEAKEAQVLALDKTSLEAKLAVSLGNGEFKLVTIKLWDRHDDPRPVIPVIEAAKITQGKLQFYTPNLNADPEPVHDKQFVLIASLGGAQICWVTESAMLHEARSNARGPVAAPSVSAPVAAPLAFPPISRDLSRQGRRR